MNALVMSASRRHDDPLPGDVENQSDAMRWQKHRGLYRPRRISGQQSLRRD